MIPGPAPGLRGWIAAWLREEEIEDGWGPLMRRVSDIDAAIAVGLTVTLSDLTAEEFRALCLLREERDRWNEERSQREEAMRQGMQQSMRKL